MSLSAKKAHKLASQANLNVDFWIHQIDAEISIHANLGLSSFASTINILALANNDNKLKYHEFIKANELTDVFDLDNDSSQNQLLKQAIAEALKQYYKDLNYSVQIKPNTANNDYLITISW